MLIIRPTDKNRWLLMEDQVMKEQKTLFHMMLFPYRPRQLLAKNGTKVQTFSWGYYFGFLAKLAKSNPFIVNLVRIKSTAWKIPQPFILPLYKKGFSIKNNNRKGTVYHLQSFYRLEQKSFT